MSVFTLLLLTAVSFLVLYTQRSSLASQPTSVWREKSDDRVLFRIFCLGGKIRVEIDGGQGSAAEGRCFLGGSGGMPPRKFLKF